MSRTKSRSLRPVVLLTCAGLAASIMALVMTYPLTRAAASEPAAPEPIYAVKNLGTLGGGLSIARDINDAGQVVGQSTTEQSESQPSQTRAFLWKESQGMKDLGMKDLGVLDTKGTASFGRGINNPTPERQHAQVVGYSRISDSNTPVHGFLWERDPMTDLGTLTEPSDSGPPTTFSNSEAWSINDKGVAVGRAFNSNSQGRAVLWKNGQIETNIGASLNTPYSEAWSVNELGQVVGEAGSADGRAKAFLYDDRTDEPTPIDPLIDRSQFFPDPRDLPNSYTFSEAMGINDPVNDDPLRVVGWVYRTTTNNPPSTPPGPEGKAFLYQEGADGAATVRPLEPVAGKPYSRARDVDEFGRVVGWSRGTVGANDGEQFSATLWENGNPTDLNRLIPAESRWSSTAKSGWKLTDAYAINKKGQIVGAGYHYSRNADGTVNPSQLQAFLLTPDTSRPNLSVSHTADGSNGWNTTSPVTLNISASEPVSGLEGDPTCTDGTNTLTLAAGSTAGTWTANVSGEGTHNITCTVSDKVGYPSGEKYDTVKIDTLAPSVGCSATPNKLRTSANNHKLVDIEATVTPSDTGSGPGGFELVSVTSSQPDSGLGPDDVPGDIQGWEIGKADTSGQLRAERYVGSREYTLTYRANDLAGNTAECKPTVTVPKGG